MGLIRAGGLEIFSREFHCVNNDFICVHFYFVFKGTFTQLLESFDVQPCSLLQQGLFATDGQTD